MYYVGGSKYGAPEVLRNFHLLLKATFRDDPIGWRWVEKCKAGFVLDLHASDQPTAVSQLAAGVGPGKSGYLLDSLIDSCAPLILCPVLVFNSIGGSCEGYDGEFPAPSLLLVAFLSLVKYFRYVVASECQALRQSDGDDSFYIRA